MKTVDDLLWAKVMARMTVTELEAMLALRMSWDEKPPEEQERAYFSVMAIGDASDCADCGCAAKYHGTGDRTLGAPCLLPGRECDGYRPGVP